MNYANVRVVKHRGHGGFGSVDEVIDPEGNTFARKTFSINQPFPVTPDLAANVKRRFTREAKLQGAINHKNIVPVLYSNIIADPPFFFMPLADGTLADDITAGQQLGGHYLEALLDIISGLEEIHSMAIFHRDLKPGNVLRFRDDDAGGRRCYYAIGDFGLISLSNTKSSVLTPTGMRLGTDYYTAPEIVGSLKAASAQSDIFSLGCILHDLVGIEDRIPCHEIRENGPYSGILLSCTRKDPSRRFKSVTRVREALLAVGAVAAIPATPDGATCAQILDREGQPLNEGEWQLVADFLEDHFGQADAEILFRKITIDHIPLLTEQFPLIGRAIGSLYARWIKAGTFGFSECDGLANRLERFLQQSPIDIKAECLIALLFMGTDHNRWYVEKKFAAAIGPSLSPDLAKRLAVEFRADDVAICKAIARCEHSISWSRSKAHPLLVETLEQICNAC